MLKAIAPKISGFKTWIAQNDKSIVYNNQELGEGDGIVVSLKEEQPLMSY
jgi:type II restriction enzyme